MGGVLSKVYRTEVSPEEYLAYTTEEKEKVKLQAYAKKFGGIFRKASCQWQKKCVINPAKIPGYEITILCSYFSITCFDRL